MRSKLTFEDRDSVLSQRGSNLISPRELAAFARSERDKAISAGEASSIFETFVNGNRGANEDTVRLPGPIVYEFSYWQPVIEFALAWLKKESPVLTGRYQASHRVMIGSQFISADTPIAADEEVIIVNTQPYSRKIEVGHTKFSMPDYIYERCSQAVKRQFGRGLQVFATQVLIPGGYILRGRFRRGVKQFARTKLQKDTQAGARMTYPAMKMRFR